MFNIDHIDFNDDIYENLIKTKKGTPKKGRGNIFPHYDGLISHIKWYLKISPYFENIKSIYNTKLLVHNELYNLYDSESKDIKTLKKEIKKKTISDAKTKNGLVCPYCGIKRNEIHDLDHYMPRSKYPEYSILSNNLIYVCTTCNQDYKKNEFLDSSNLRKFLNPYYDSILDTKEVIRCIITINGNILNIEFKANQLIQTESKYLYQVIQNHIDTLDLDNRYNKLIRQDLLDKFFNKFREKSILNQRQIRNYELDEVYNYINDKIDELFDSPINNFEILFWKEFIKCKSYFECIKGQVL